MADLKKTERAIRKAQQIVNGLKADAENTVMVGRHWREGALERASHILLDADTELRKALDALAAPGVRVVGESQGEKR